jgi:hypothetical protein
VFKLVKILIGLVGLGAFVWWGLTVPLGDRTLFQHVTAIAGSKESKDLVRGTKDKVADLKKRALGPEKDAPTRASSHSDPDRTADRTERSSERASDRLTDADRHDMRKLIDSAHRKVTRTN